MEYVYQPYENAAYESVTDFLDAVKRPAVCPANIELSQRCLMSAREWGGDWLGAGCQTTLDVLDRIEKGWAEGLQQSQDALGNLDQQDALTPIDRRRRLTRSDMGDDYDANLARIGKHDRAWTTARRNWGYTPQNVQIVANMICSGGDEPSVLFWRGAAATALADILGNAGYNVKLSVGFAGDAYGAGRPSCRVVVKQPDMPLDLSTASAVLLPGFFRAAGHTWLVNHARKHRTGCGISVGEIEIDASCEYLLSHEVKDKDTARKALNRIIAAVNGDAEDIRHAM